jgi:peptide/nickel transport system substrate-binding protein
MALTQTCLGCLFMTMPHWFRVILPLALFSLFFSPFFPCSAGEGNTLRLGLHVSGMGRLDPHFAAGSQDRAVADMVFNGLLRYAPGNAPHFEPDLARKIPEFEIKNGRQVWLIQLKKGVIFHKGPLTKAYELTADDVVFSLEKSKDKEQCAYAGEYQGMTVEKQDRYEVRITLETPLSPTLFFPKISNYNGGFIISKKAVQTMGHKAFETHPVGTGPFAFSTYEKGSSLTLTAHENYFRGRPRLDGVEIRFIPDIGQRRAAFENRELDVMIGNGEKGWLEEIRNQKDNLIDIHGVGEVATLHFNLNIKPMDDVRVRQAIAYGLSRDDFLNASDPEIAGPVYSPVPDRFLPGGLSHKEVELLDLDYRQNLDNARQLLKAAGYPNGFSLELVSSEKRVYRTWYRILQQQLEKIGVICNVKIVTHKQMHRMIRSEPKPLVIYAAWRPNADVYLSRFFHSDSIIVSGKKPDTNFSGYDRIDALIEAARTQVDPVAQVRLWEQAQIKILNDMAAYPLMFTKQMFIRHPYVDYGHSLVSTMALYPQFTEKTFLKSRTGQ